MNRDELSRSRSRAAKKLWKQLTPEERLARTSAGGKQRWKDLDEDERRKAMEKVVAASVKVTRVYKKRCPVPGYRGIHKFRPRGMRIPGSNQPDLERGGYYVCQCGYIKPKS